MKMPMLHHLHEEIRPGFYFMRIDAGAMQMLVSSFMVHMSAHYMPIENICSKICTMII